jgi:hypothetical protein
MIDKEVAARQEHVVGCKLDQTVLLRINQSLIFQMKQGTLLDRHP